MKKAIALCADEEILREPSIIGLGGERLDSQEWLVTYSRAHEAREGLSTAAEIEEVWVAETHEIEPINLAAALKRDRPDLRICLCYNRESGSFRSRAHIAGIDELLDQSALVRRYTATKQKYGLGSSDVAEEAPSVSSMTVESKASGAEKAFSPEDEPIDKKGEGADEKVISEAERIVLEAVRKVEDSASAQPLSAGSASACFLLPIVSGSGGSGKSTVAALCALYAQQCGYKTAVVDLDLQFGDMKQVLAVHDAVEIDRLVDTPTLIESVAASEGKLALVSAPARLEVAERVTGKVPEILDELSSRFDVVIANTGATWADQHMQLLERSSKAIFIVDQSASSLRACKHAVDLCARCGIATGPFLFAVNRVGKHAPLTSMDVSCALHGAQVAELSQGGRDVEDFISAGCIDQLLESDNDLVQSVKLMLSEVLPDFSEKAEASSSRKHRRGGKRGSRSRLQRGKEIA